MLPIETTTKLLKLHLQWPERGRYAKKDNEAYEFYKWLFVNHHERSEVLAIDDLELVGDFLDRNRHVLWPTKKEEDSLANLRLEPRIENDVLVQLSVTASPTEEETGTSMAGRTLDLGLHGMRVAVPGKLSRGAMVQLHVESDGDNPDTYNLTAELRWAAEIESGHLIGLRLIKGEGDFTAWQENFGAQFVAPAMASKRGR